MRKNSLTRQVRRAYRQDELARICTLREDRFGRAFGMQTVKIAQPVSSWRRSSDRPEDYYHFRDNGSSVLAVAHLDTVVSQKGRTPRFRATERGPLVVSGALDDRLGAYVILRLLPELGVTCDWLFTVGEESGQSTAEHFDAQGKKYDWVIEFDRGSSRDVVMYQYEDRASRQLVEASGAVMGQGSFSDIAYLDQLGVKCFNWGVGYGGDYHSERGYAYLNDTFSMTAKYLRFHEQNAGTRMPHDPDGYSGRYGSKRHWWDEADDDYYGDCMSCGKKAVVDSVTWYCTFCGVCQDCGGTDPDIAADWNDPDADICQCYAPKPRGTGDPDDRDWRAMNWDEYCRLRPAGPNDAALKKAHAEAQDRDGAGPLISAAPPWSEHRPSYGLGVPTGQKNRNPKLSPSAARPAWDELRPTLERAVAAYTTTSTTMNMAASAINPPAVFPDADLGWHHAARNGDRHVVGHEPGQNWARVCLRCAARWPHPIADSDPGVHAGHQLPDEGYTALALHLESDCPGCERCTADWWTRTGTKHVIPAHLAGESDICSRCLTEAAALSETDRGNTLELETS